MSKLYKILIIDDDEDVLFAAKMLLKQHYYEVITSKDPQEIPSLMEKHSFDVYLLDMNFVEDVTSGMEGIYWLKEILKIDSNAFVIMITAYGGVELAVKAIKEGAVDFITKPWQNEKLLSTITLALNLRTSRIETVKLKEQQKRITEDQNIGFHNMIGTGDAMQQVFKTIKKVGSTDVDVLILGENGTGKELVARALHQQSNRRESVFMSVDMGAIKESLCESELFGHMRGAFTDARENRAGRFEVASGGTLFLDEIGNIPLSVQAKLLKVLEERQVYRLGSNKPIPIDIRLICATNMPLYEMVEEKKFRQDLLYRINTVVITLPPLWHRVEDIPLLVDHFMEVYSRKYNKEIRGIERNALVQLCGYPWPGNIRELKHSIERAVIMSESNWIDEVEVLLPRTRKKDGEIDFPDYNLEKIEEIIISKVLGQQNGNVSQAAHILGLSRAALYRRMEKYGI